MEGQIRLADRQGLLTGPRLSPVQHYAGYVLNILKRITEMKREDRELRLAMLASGHVDPAELFDEFKEIITDDEAEIDDGADANGDPVSTVYDYSNVELNRSPEEIQREVEAMLAEAQSGRATFEDIEYGEWI